MKQTPLGLPPWILVCLYCIIVTSTGAGYYNWPPFSSLLYGSGAYEWLCESTTDQFDDVNSKYVISRQMSESTDDDPIDLNDSMRKQKFQFNLGGQLSGARTSQFSASLATYLISSSSRPLRHLETINQTEFHNREVLIDSTNSTVKGRVWLPTCNDQKIRLVELYTLGFVVSQVGGLISGAYMDWMGPRITAMTGQFLCGIGWLLLSYASESHQIYGPAMLFIGSSVSLIGLPGNWVAVLFPRNSGFSLSVISAAFDGSFCVPLVMLYVWRTTLVDYSYRYLLESYVAFIVLPMFILSFLFFPMTLIDEDESIGYDVIPDIIKPPRSPEMFEEADVNIDSVSEQFHIKSSKLSTDFMTNGKGRSHIDRLFQNSLIPQNIEHRARGISSCTLIGCLSTNFSKDRTILSVHTIRGALQSGSGRCGQFRTLPDAWRESLLRNDDEADRWDILMISNFFISS